MTQSLSSARSTERPRGAAEYVAGVRILGQRRPLWFGKKIDENGRIEVGRTRQRPLRIKDAAVSRLHCEIQRVEPGVYFLRDLGSRNLVKYRTRGFCGEWVNLNSREKLYLLPGMHIKLGNTIVVPVGSDGLCPIMARNHLELTERAIKTYGSEATAGHIAGRSRQWVRELFSSLTRMFT